MRNERMGPVEWALLAVLALVWGSAFFFYKLLDQAQLPPFTIVAGRVGVAALVLVPVVLLSGRRLPTTPRALGAFVLLGLLNNVVPFSLIIVSEKRLDSGLAAVFNATTPIFTALIAQVMLHDEKLTPARIGGILLGLLGVVLLMGPSALRGFDLTSLAQLASIGAAISYAIAIVYARRIRPLGIDPLVLTCGQLIAATAIALPLALGLEHPREQLTALAAPEWWAWLGLAIPGTAIAYVIYFRIMTTAGATNAASVTFLAPIVAVLLGTLVLGEHPAPTTLAGMLVIFAGQAVLDGRTARYLGEP
ncbi:MAG TPA: EamA family transporter [Candidatus Sulfotelmatobacter sp.]|nr:EamA family transporter [Candidatus Sulfotelmatobacter sp.]